MNPQIFRIIYYFEAALGQPTYQVPRIGPSFGTYRSLVAKSIDDSLSFPNYDPTQNNSCANAMSLYVGPPTSGNNNTIYFPDSMPPAYPPAPPTYDSRISIYNTKSNTEEGYLAFCPPGIPFDPTWYTYLQPKNTNDDSFSNLKDMQSENTGGHYGRNLTFYFDGDDPTGEAGNLLCDNGAGGIDYVPVGEFLKCRAPGMNCSQDYSKCKWRNDPEIFGCCTTNPTLYASDELNQLCGPAFMPGVTEGSLCTDFMVNVCQNNWYDECEQYLDNYKDNPDVGKVVIETIKNYINNLSSKCGWNDYTSSSLGNTCTYTGEDKNHNPVTYTRDDSKDHFFTKVIPDLCSTIADSENNCDEILNQYCSQFTRENLANDKTLQTLCGCHLQTSNCNSVPPCKTNAGLILHNPPLLENQYPYPGIGIECDSLCATGAIQSKIGKCAETVCIMNDTKINTLNSDCGNITISQICKGAVGSSSICYMSDTGINTINSDCGKEFIHQNCGECFTYDSKKPWVVKKVECLSGSASGSESGSKTTGSFMDWIKGHPWYTAGTISVLVLLIFIVIYFGFIHHEIIQ